MSSAQALTLLQQTFDTLKVTADSDIDTFEDEEEAQDVPAQYACRKSMEVTDLSAEPANAGVDRRGRLYRPRPLEQLVRPVC